MSVASYWMAAAMVALGAALNIIEWRYVGHFVLIFMMINTGLYLFFRSGLNLCFADASITAPQILLSLIPFLYAMYYSNTALGRIAILMTSFVSLLYGILDLSQRRFLMVTSVYFTGYFGLFALLSSQNPGLIQVPGEWMILAAMALLMLQMGLIGGYISQLRNNLRRKNLQISEMATRDELTGSYNRRHLVAVLETEYARMARNGDIFSICLMDIDHFKKVNDKHGHPAGDEVLRRIVEQILHDIRDIDTFGRHGGEEFLLIMPQTPAHDIQAVADRLRTSIEQLQFTSNRGPRFSITVSMGVAETDETTPSYADLLYRADEALYQAKRSGRNRVCMAEAVAPGIGTQPLCVDNANVVLRGGVANS